MTVKDAPWPVCNVTLPGKLSISNEIVSSAAKSNMISALYED